ncbi:MAG TPA: hypothetical protein DD734_06155 [Firmicutes bacterium]|nr:hypothetical protein [Bacillota bacterium]
MTRTFAAVFPQVYIFPVHEWRGLDDIYEQNITLIATLNPDYQPKAVWQSKARQFHAQQLITEDVPTFVQTLVDDPLVFQETWLAGVPLLTDDYAPVDTLKNPLL